MNQNVNFILKPFDGPVVPDEHTMIAICFSPSTFNGLQSKYINFSSIFYYFFQRSTLTRIDFHRQCQRINFQHFLNYFFDHQTLIFVLLNPIR